MGILDWLERWDDRRRERMWASVDLIVAWLDEFADPLNLDDRSREEIAKETEMAAQSLIAELDPSVELLELAETKLSARRQTRGLYPARQMEISRRAKELASR